MALPKADSHRQKFDPSRAAAPSAGHEKKGGDEAHDVLASHVEGLQSTVDEVAGKAVGAPESAVAGKAEGAPEGTAAAAAAAVAAAEKASAAAEEEKAPPNVEATVVATVAEPEAAVDDDLFEVISDGAQTPDGFAPHTPEEHSEAEGGEGAGEGAPARAEKRGSVDTTDSAESAGGGGGVAAMWKKLEKKAGGKALAPNTEKKADDTDVRFFGGMRFTKVPAAFAKHKADRKKELLKRGFEERISKKTGKLFYYELATGKSHWTLPEAPAGGGAAVPLGYELRTSKSRGKPYYVHVATGAVSWELPAAGSSGGGGGSKKTAIAAAPAAAPALSAEELKARGLELRHSTKKNRDYYYRASDGTSHWQLPEA